MTDRNIKYEEGQIVLFYTGDYSDYQITMVCKVLKPFDSVLLTEIGKNECCEAKVYSGDGYPHMKGKTYEVFHMDKMLALLVTRGYVEELPNHEVFLGDYDGWNIWETGYETNR